jgi:hypothetical protein
MIGHTNVVLIIHISPRQELLLNLEKIPYKKKAVEATKQKEEKP